MGIGTYARRARAMGVANFVLLHLGHEVLWETGPSVEDLATSVSMRGDGRYTEAKHFFKEYAEFDYVFRNYYSRAYAQHSLYLPLGTGLGYPAEAMAVPVASARRHFCVSAFEQGMYHWN